MSFHAYLRAYLSDYKKEEARPTPTEETKSPRSPRKDPRETHISYLEEAKKDISMLSRIFNSFPVEYGSFSVLEEKEKQSLIEDFKILLKESKPSEDFFIISEKGKIFLNECLSNLSSIACAKLFDENGNIKSEILEICPTLKERMNDHAERKHEAYLQLIAGFFTQFILVELSNFQAFQKEKENIDPDLRYKIGFLTQLFLRKIHNTHFFTPIFIETVEKNIPLDTIIANEFDLRLLNNEEKNRSTLSKNIEKTFLASTNEDQDEYIFLHKLWSKVCKKCESVTAKRTIAETLGSQMIMPSSKKPAHSEEKPTDSPKSLLGHSFFKKFNLVIKAIADVSAVEKKRP